jgi:hypothetical protein
MLSRFLITVLVTAHCYSVHALDGVDPNTLEVAGKPLFNHHDVLDLTLVADFDAMCRPNEVEDCQYSPTTMKYMTADGSEVNIPVEIRVRGGWRARKDHCAVPPLFVRFSSEGTSVTPFAGQDMLPLTTHCRSSGSRKSGGAPGSEYEQYVLREYLGYRLYNTLSDKSLRVRLARINYMNPAESAKPITRYAFFTEHFDEMAARQAAERLSWTSFDHEKIDLPSFDQVALFNFMIGNTDWSVVRQRNIVLIGTADGRQYPVPFDLDMSGLVNAEYGGVSPRLDFRDPRQRYYLGFCHPQVDFETLFSQFQGKKNEMLALGGDIPGISRSTRNTSQAYLKKFFKVIESPERRQKAIIGACHPWPPSPNDHTTPPDAS